MGKLNKWLIAIVILLVAAGLVALSLHHRHAREHVLADGSVLRLAMVHFGKEEHYKITTLREDMEDWFRKWLPLTKKWLTPPLVTPKRTGPRWFTVSEGHTNSDALWMYFTRRASGPTNYQNVDIRGGELLDSHGCIFIETQMGGSDDGRLPPNRPGFGGQSSVDWLRFEAFPRHEKEFRLRLYDRQQKFLTEFWVKNPAYTPLHPTNWLVESLPISKTNNNVTFILYDVTIMSNAPGIGFRPLLYQPPVIIHPTFKFLENGAPTMAWQALDMELWDSSGNFASKIGEPIVPRLFLCPHEPVWKLRVTFYADETATGASNVVWTIPKVRVPGTGEFVELDVRRTVLLDRVDVLALAGPGKVTYSNKVPTKATSELPEQDGMPPVSSVTGRINRDTGLYDNIQTVSFRTPHIAMYLWGLTNNERLTICATDEHGRKFYARTWMWRFRQREKPKPDEINYLETEPRYRNTRGPTFYQLDLPEDCQMVDLTLCVHYPVVEEFVFKPPR